MRLFEFATNLEKLQDPNDPHSGNAPKESDVPEEHKSILNPSLILTDMDPGHDYYRFMMLAAASPNNVPVTSPIKDIPFAMPYTKQDEDMLHHALSRMGKKHKHLTPSKGKDPTGTNTTSPVAKIKRNKYGV
jgi:hypothetical protein